MRQLQRPGGDVDPIELRHPDIDNQEVGLELLAHLQCFEAIGGLARHRQSGLALEQAS